MAIRIGPGIVVGRQGIRLSGGSSGLPCTDFSGLAPGSVPEADWDSNNANIDWRIVSGDFAGGQALKTFASSNNSYGTLTWTAAGLYDTGELTARMKSGQTGSIREHGGITFGSMRMYFMRNGTNYIAYNSTALGSLVWVPDTWYWMSIRLTGTHAEFRFWDDGDDRPSSPAASVLYAVTNNGIAVTSGQLGVVTPPDAQNPLTVDSLCVGAL